MILILEKLIYTFGLIINFQMLLNILVRPVLWSTTNTFIGCLLASNFFYLTFQSLLDQANEVPIPDENIILHFLEYNFSDNFNSLICSAQFISQFLHGTISILTLVSIVFIRSMMVKHADDIRMNNCKTHQARLSYIGIFVAVFILTACTGVVISIFIYPLSPSEYVLVRSCRGVVFEYESIRYGMWLRSSVILVLFTVATFTCQLRIILYRRKYNKSYFSKYRQNIATMNQLLFVTYVTIIISFIKEAIVITILLNSTPIIDYQTFLRINALINCIIIPSYWMYSTRKEFYEFWSIETCFWKAKKRNKLQTIEVQMAPLEPRRQISSEVSSEYEGRQQDESTRVSGSSSFGFRSNMPFRQPKI